MKFFFVRDHKGHWQYFSSDPAKPIQVKFSRSREVWELAKRKLMLLPHKTLRMEQAFERALRIKEQCLPIVYADSTHESKVHLSFSLFLQKQRTTHINVLVCEAILVPISGLVAFLPGPNIAFYALALLMITQWLALRGINRTIKAEHTFIPDKLLGAWDEAVRSGEVERYPEVLASIEGGHHIKDIRKILYK
jgi:hypothetical protein